MPTTPRGYEYPPGGDFTDIPGDLQALAESVDADVAAEVAARTAAIAALTGTSVQKALIDAAGDLIVGTAADTVARLAKGADGTVLGVTGGAVGWTIPSSGPTRVYKTADESVASSATLQDDDDLVVPVAANKTYLVRAVLLVSGATGGDIRVGFTAPAGAAMDWSLYGPSSSLTSPTVNTSNNTMGIAIGTVAANIVAGVAPNVFALLIYGVLTVDATAGSLALTWAQGSSNATATVVRAGSMIEIDEAA